MGGRSRADTTSAEDKSIGFEYQYYFFLYQLLNIKHGQAVGLEVYDDVHVELPDGKQVLFQLKHTVQKNASGDQANLTTLDGDLWKSLSNWSKQITDPNDGRESRASQLDFLRLSAFVLASNKSESAENSFLVSFTAFKEDHKTHAELITDLKAIKATSESKTIRGYIDDVLGLDPDVSEGFFKNLDLSLGLDQIIEKCRISIAEKQIDVSKIEDVFSKVNSRIHTDVYESIKAREKIVIDFDEFNRRCRRYFDQVRSERLVIREVPDPMPDGLFGHTFIKQLVDIGDVDETDLEFVSRAAGNRLNFLNNLQRWLHDGDITQLDIDRLEKEAHALWEALFRAAYPGRRSAENEDVVARGIVGGLRREKLPLASDVLPVTMSNGGFYELSDRPIIGWLLNWKDRYK
ncbi:hypothetical protein HF263_28795 [Rhizobium leguminosarum]|uniref:hypothetical protein n=1 Tax=Rhizobium leguminosarum TaxID=384 RepID=UPI001C926F30|nr:hypothetical protein [Rhizobium leguminosarum]MBY2996199.1 hypothetical protein [Rhizobium leguminosarum]MBY3060021.1 hypothetical protein [Rhizobium leguminosarum]